MKMRSITVYLLIGWSLAPITRFVNEYVFSDWDYLRFLFVIMAVDTLLGLYKAILAKDISSKGYGMVIKKIIVYSAALIATNVLVKFTINGATQIAFGWMNSVVYSAIIAREAISIFENIAVIDPKAMPKRLLKYLKDFDSFTGRPLKLKDEQTISNNKTQSK